ncbi:MAG: methyltransferase domain-containing protein [Pseudomonadota bacterium]
MADHKDHLSRVYGLDTQDATNAYYDDWAATYDAELIDAGYVTPQRCAVALARHMPDLSAAVLDVGCGTGLSGAAFAKHGFTTIDGSDVSGGMLDIARRRGVYRSVVHADADDPFPFKKGTYAALAAVGVVGAGAAPISVLEAMLDKLGEGGLIVFSFNDHTLADPDYLSAVERALDSGRFVLLSKEHGPHIPKTKLEATVFVMQAR